MTRASQKADERRHAERFFRALFRGEDTGLVFEFPEPPAPAVWVRGVRLAEVAGAGVNGVAVELREYHPAAWGREAYPRSDVDGRWQNEMLPAIEAARQGTLSVKSVAASFDFNDIRLPKKRDHRVIAEELVRVVEATIPQIPPDRSVLLCFISRDDLSRIPPDWCGLAFLPSEDFPLATEHFAWIRLKSYPDEEWPPWVCPRMLGGWNTPSANEFSLILDAKAEKAKKYDTQGRALWLLIVAELTNDQESHIFPRREDYLLYLREQISAATFDFADGPFQQVWLFSEFTEGTVRLYPVGSVVP
jgi:hypothetical protein